jgi:uncharacterized SAM-binding protein YcdF (DUF218 family)
VRRHSRSLRRLGWLALAIFVLWLGGLVVFITTGLLRHTDRSIVTDAIVVLTGGRMRLETGLQLLAARTAKKLFISGVDQRVDRDALLHALGPSAERAACCIVLGHEADNTFGNARETAGWMRMEGYRSLRLVTSWYHMPRSLLEFERAMPGTTIVAHAVFVQRPEPDRWWNWYGALPLVVGEYDKYLMAWLWPGLNAASPPRATASDSRR